MSCLGACLEGLKNLHISQNTQNTNNTQNKRSSKSNHDSYDKEVLKGLIEHKTKQVSEKSLHSLETLPSDLLKHKIISYLAFQDLLSVLMLSKKIHRCINFEDLLSTVAREGSQKLTKNPEVDTKLIKEDISKWVRFLELNNYQIPKWRNRFFKAKQGIKKVVKFNKKAKVVNVTSPYVQIFFEKKIIFQKATDVFLKNVPLEFYLPILRFLEGYSVRYSGNSRKKIDLSTLNLIFENLFKQVTVVTLLNKNLEKGLIALKKFPLLQSLNLRDCCGITDGELSHLSGLSSLTSLNLRNCWMIKDEGLNHLSGLPSLTSLNLEGCRRITDKGLNHLSRLPSLTSLNLRDCWRITDKGLKHLSRLPSLTSLNLRGCWNITNEGVAYLRSRLSLHHLLL